MKPLFISIPHSGEVIPGDAYWLKGLPELVLMCDVDRYVDLIYGPGIDLLGLPSIVAKTHRYVVDLNRVPSDVDEDSVEGSVNPRGSFTTGLHWVETTTKAPLIKDAIPQVLHKELVRKYYEPFHLQVRDMYKTFEAQGHSDVFHLDLHSMPSIGTSAHRDPGQKRAQVVVSDQDGKSCSLEFKDIVIKAYKTAGFEVEYNWPYKGGKITETYGQPALGHHTIQVEINRSLYMNEISKQKYTDQFAEVQRQVSKALGIIVSELKE